MADPTKNEPVAPTPNLEKAPEPEPDPEDCLFEALWYGEVDGEVFDGDPADLW